jgi:hypothetical protein
MLRKLRPRSIYDVFALLALLVAVGGTSAYAANEWTGANIVDGSLTGQDVFDNTVGGADITNESLRSTDIASGAVTSSELAPFSINEGDIGSNVIDSRHINNGSLNDEDIGQGAFVDFQASIGTVSAHTCRFDLVLTGINAQGDHLLLTPNYNTADPGLIYDIQYVSDAEYARLRVCNPTNSNIDDGTTKFNLLVIDAQ